MELKERLILTALFALMLLAQAEGQGMYGGVPCQARTPQEAYCISHGGCPKDGYCNFPDGSSCELNSFYNGTCPGAAFYEEAIWMNEAYNFLYGDIGYTSPYVIYQYPVGSPYYYSAPANATGGA